VLVIIHDWKAFKILTFHMLHKQCTLKLVWDGISRFVKLLYWHFTIKNNNKEIYPWIILACNLQITTVWKYLVANFRNILIINPSILCPTLL
jgi:hypothetical protein